MKKALFAFVILTVAISIASCYSTIPPKYDSYQDPSVRYGVKPNAYGLGVNSDIYGRPSTYRTQDGEPLSPIFYNNVRRNAYGPGIHMDQFGRPVYDSPWPR
jgi:hypothetical protein